MWPRHHIEVGRYTKVPREENVYICQNNIDDECHFFLHSQIKGYTYSIIESFW
jgi:hypothetical protein